MQEKYEKLNKLAREVLILSRNTLLVNLRFLDSALSRLEYFPIDDSYLLTEGTHILYNPKYVLDCYKMEKEMPVRDYLHITLHCIFRHMYMDPKLNRAYWDLACDIAVECIIGELNLKATHCSREKEQIPFINAFKAELKTLTAEKIYHYLTERYASEDKVQELREIFFADNHAIWYMTFAEIESKYGLSLGNGGSGDGDDDDDSEEEGSAFRQQIYEDWKSISERMEMELETFAKQQGDKAGGLTQNLKAVNREKYDYTAFLKKFAVMGEAMKINDDEFDYIFYTYGLELYDDMPLIEPLEYKEVKRIKEFVIAIDTSGSTSGELVQKFVQKTYNILKSTESFFSKINLHIIQCDAEIQETVKITNQDEFDEYLKNMKIHGLGGTDFRPVFSHVDKLIQEKEFSNLKGLIYFTDGYGEFPKKKPDYETAFVFVEDEYNNPNVPPWAIKLVLQKDEI